MNADTTDCNSLTRAVNSFSCSGVWN